MNGTMRPHEKAIGYVVLTDSSMIGTLCRGVSDADNKVLLGGNPCTIFPSRRAAQRAIDGSNKDDPARMPGRFQIIRAAFPKK